MRHRRHRRRLETRETARIAFADVLMLPRDRLETILASEPRESIRWIAAAARYGLIEAQLLLGQMLLDGRGAPMDPEAALVWFQTAAAGGSADAMNMVGRCHEMGWGIDPDPVTAAQWYGRAAAAGLDWGQYNLANLLLRGRGIARDRQQALAWYLCAARQDHAKSMNVIGRFFEEGWEVATDIRLAQLWYRRAAERGDFRGKYNLGTLLVRQGCMTEAAHWLRQAVQAGTYEFLCVICDDLSRQREPVLREVGRLALRRIVTGMDSAAPS